MTRGVGGHPTLPTPVRLAAPSPRTGTPPRRSTCSRHRPISPATSRPSPANSKTPFLSATRIRSLSTSAAPRPGFPLSSTTADRPNPSEPDPTFSRCPAFRPFAERRPPLGASLPESAFTTDCFRFFLPSLSMHPWPQKKQSYLNRSDSLPELLLIFMFILS
jgi:hypothetical protein